MEDFTQKLKALQKHLRLKDVEIARAAFPGDSEARKKDQRDFANYYSRIKRDGIDDPGLEFLENIARGMLLTLSQFFELLENSGAAPTDRPTAVADMITTARNLNMHLGNNDSDREVSTPEEISRRRALLFDLAHVLADTAEHYAREQTATPGARKPESPARRRRISR